jgi:O-methyltransferase
MLKTVVKTAISALGYELHLHPKPAKHNIPDAELYRPLFSPWLGEDRFAKYIALASPRTLVSPDRCWIISAMLTQALQLEGDIWECGVYRGGTAAMMAAIMRDNGSSKRLVLFDTFEGMPETDAKRDWHKAGDFADTSVEAVRAYVGDNCTIVKGFIPDTFNGLEDRKVAFSHIDVDIYRSVLDCVEFIWPRLSLGGFVVFDDYGFPTCPGARLAVDEFFTSTAAIPLCLPTGQAIVFKSADQAA